MILHLCVETYMKDPAAISTAASTPAVAVTAAHWFGAHIPEYVMVATAVLTTINLAAWVYKLVRWAAGKGTLNGND